MSIFKSKWLPLYAVERADGHTPKVARSIAKHNARYEDPRSKKRDLMPCRYEAYEGGSTTILPNGWKIKVAFEHDTDCGPPEKECDGHGVVVNGRVPQQFSGWELSDFVYYDWKQSLQIALRDNWNRCGKDRNKAMNAVRRDYEYLRGWYEDQWWYVGMIVTLLDEKDVELAEESCWDYESDCMDYLCSEARSWAAYMIRSERKNRRESARQARIESRFRDAMNCGV